MAEKIVLSVFGNGVDSALRAVVAEPTPATRALVLGITRVDISEEPYTTVFRAEGELPDDTVRTLIDRAKACSDSLLAATMLALGGVMPADLI